MRLRIFPGHFKSLRQTKFHQLRTPVFVCCCTLGVASGAFALFGVRLNTTASLPIGLYIVSKSPSAKLAEFCPPEPFAQISVARGYRHRGTCPDGNSPLLKPIVANQGDVVETSDKGIMINGRFLNQTAPRDRDSKGRPLTHFAFGTFVVAEGFVWVVSTYNPLSFDSRYFGPIPRRSIKERLKPLLVR